MFEKEILYCVSENIRPKSIIISHHQATITPKYLQHKIVCPRQAIDENRVEIRYKYIIWFSGGGIVQIGICDDQKEIREMIIDKVKKLYPAEDIVSYGSGQEVLDALHLPDILFLDIQMPGMDGLETAGELRKLNRQMIIIFVTVTGDYVFRSFDVGAFHYLIKPFEDEKFEEVLHNAVRQYRERKTERTGIKKEMPSLMVTANGKHITIPMEDVVYAEVFNRKIIIHTMDADIEFYGKMKELEKKAGDDFYRSHRAYLINLNFIRKYDAKTIYLENAQVPVSKQNYHDFVKCYLRFNQRKGKE